MAQANMSSIFSKERVSVGNGRVWEDGREMEGREGRERVDSREREGHGRS